MGLALKTNSGLLAVNNVRSVYVSNMATGCQTVPTDSRLCDIKLNAVKYWLMYSYCLMPTIADIQTLPR